MENPKIHPKTLKNHLKISKQMMVRKKNKGSFLMEWVSGSIVRILIGERSWRMRFVWEMMRSLLISLLILSLKMVFLGLIKFLSMNLRVGYALVFFLILYLILWFPFPTTSIMKKVSLFVLMVPIITVLITIMGCMCREKSLKKRKIQAKFTKLPIIRTN